MNPLSSWGNGAGAAVTGDGPRKAFGDCVVGRTFEVGDGSRGSAIGIESPVDPTAISPPKQSTATNTAVNAPTRTGFFAEMY
jgi:hypothetical protein